MKNGVFTGGLALSAFLLLTSTLALSSPGPNSQGTQPAPTATPPNLSHLPEKAPLGWDQHIWDRTRIACNAIAQKSRAHHPLTEGEHVQAQTCMSLGYELLNPQTAPLPGSYQSP